MRLSRNLREEDDLPTEKVKCNQCSRIFVSSADLADHKRANHPALVSDDQLGQAAKSAIYEYLTSDGKDREVREKARVGVGMISAEARKEAARNNALAMSLAAVGRMAESSEEFHSLMQIAMPELPVVKAINQLRSKNAISTTEK